MKGKLTVLAAIGALVLASGALAALAADGDADTLDCGPGHDTAKVRGSERATTSFRACETIVVVVRPTAADDAAEADRDADAD